MTQPQHVDLESVSPPEDDPIRRRILLTPASSIKPRRVRWLWEGRIAYGTLALLAGREGLGKSTLAYQIAADITHGRLDGEDKGTPRAVIICASEDSWEHTIVPRLIAAGANLDIVFRVEIATHDTVSRGLSLPKDFLEVAWAANETGAGLLVLDPLMSVIDSKLDTHRDHELRQALEPLADLADRSRMAILGLIHHNKSGSTDALQLVMGSKAFTAVARSVHTCIPDPDDETQARRLFATSKNNLGRLDLPVLGFTITSHAVETDDDGVAWTGRINWTGEVAGSMHEIMTRASDPERSATSEAADWLRDYLAEHGGEAAKASIEKAGRVAGHNSTTLRRARERLRLEHRSVGFPRQTYWALPGTVATPTEHVDITEPRRSSDTTAEPPPSRVTTDEPALPGLSHVAVVSPDDATDATGSDLQKHDQTATNPHARAHAGGDDFTDTTGKETPLQTPSRASRVSRAGPPTRAPATQPDHDIPAPTCPDCNWPVDHPQHATTCDQETP